jgi:hypothetical protein
VAPSLQPGEVGSFPGMRCLVPQLFFTREKRLYLELLGRNWRSAVPGVNYLNKNQIDKLKFIHKYFYLLFEYRLSYYEDG